MVCYAQNIPSEGGFMKIRRELNRQLYRQKAYGFENRPSCFDKAVLDAILGGETKTLKRLISSERLSLSAGMRNLSKNELRNEKYHFMITAAFLAESGIGVGLSHDEAYMITDIYSRKADRATGRKDLQNLLEDMCLDFAERIREIKKEDVTSIISENVLHIFMKI